MMMHAGRHFIPVIKREGTHLVVAGTQESTMMYLPTSGKEDIAGEHSYTMPCLDTSS